jgi:glycosyltransferase involved in cell wall biosynthesis
VSNGSPYLSVIVPALNAGAQLNSCLDALQKSGFRDFEVVVVDDGSDESPEVLVAAKGFQYLRASQPGRPGGPARARNLGAGIARGLVLVFVDSDVCVHEDTLALFAKSFEADSDLAAVIGSYDDEPAETSFLSRYKNLSHRYYHQASGGEVGTFWSGCGAMRREIFLGFGGFDEQRYRRPAIEDIELGTWVSAAGHKIVLDPSISAKHLKRWTLWTILRSDIVDRGIPWTLLMWRAGRLAKSLNVTPAQRLSVAAACLVPPVVLFSLFWPAGWLMVAALLLTVTLLNRDYYAYLCRSGGFWFCVRCIPLHWLYLWYCAFCAALGTLIHVSGAGSPPKRSEVAQ